MLYFILGLLNSILLIYFGLFIGKYIRIRNLLNNTYFHVKNGRGFNIEMVNDNIQKIEDYYDLTKNVGKIKVIKLLEPLRGYYYLIYHDKLHEKLRNEFDVVLNKCLSNNIPNECRSNFTKNYDITTRDISTFKEEINDIKGNILKGGCFNLNEFDTQSILNKLERLENSGFNIGELGSLIEENELYTKEIKEFSYQSLLVIILDYYNISYKCYFYVVLFSTILLINFFIYFIL